MIWAALILLCTAEGLLSLSYYIITSKYVFYLKLDPILLLNFEEISQKISYIRLITIRKNHFYKIKIIYF